MVEKAFRYHDKLPTETQEKNLRTAFLLTEWSAPSNAIATALVMSHDPAQIKEKELSQTLENFDQLDAYKFDPSIENQGVYLRDLLFLKARDHGVLMLLGAKDMLILEEYNEASKPQTRDLFSEELSPEENDTMGPFLFHAHRAYAVTSSIFRILNIQPETKDEKTGKSAHEDLAGKLKDLAMVHLRSSDFHNMQDHMEEKMGMSRAESMRQLASLAGDIAITCELLNMPAGIKYRVKRVSSALEKQEKKGDVRDINGIRVIIHSEQAYDCFGLRSELKDLFEKQGSWLDVVDEFDDYIGNPKENGYQSLHILFRNPLTGYEFEVQIRTAAMDRKAEMGSAAHAGYKMGQSFAEGSEDMPDAETRFNERKTGLLNNGSFFVYDNNGTLYHLATGSRQKPVLLDLAFAINLEKGLRTVGGTIDDEPAKVYDSLENGQVVSIRASSPHLIMGNRANKVSTPLARALLQAKDHFLLDRQSPLDQQRLTEQGKKRLEALKENLRREFADFRDYFDAKPSEQYSLPRIVKLSGFASENEFFITLALLKADDPFMDNARKQLRNNLVLSSVKQYGRLAQLQLLTQTKQRGVIYRVLQLAEEQDIKLRSIEHATVGNNDFSLVTFGLATTKEQLSALQGKIEELYLDLPAPATWRGQKIDLRLRVSKSGDVLSGLLAIFDQINANIKGCSVPAPQAHQDLYYEFQLQFPEGLSKKRAQNLLDRRLNELSGIRQAIIL